MTCRSCHNFARDRARLKVARTSSKMVGSSLPSVLARSGVSIDFEKCWRKNPFHWDRYVVLKKNMDYTMYNIHLGGPQLYNPRRTSTWRWRTWRGQPRSWSGRWAFGTVVLGKWNGAKVKPAECWWTSDAQMIANFSLTSPRWLWGWWWSLRRQQGRRSL